ncbi:MAG: hypothetical protein ACI4LP_05215 [Anaerovoracaceae bacterium]
MSEITIKGVTSATETSVTLRVEARSDYTVHLCKYKIRLQIGSKTAYSEETAARDHLYIYDGFHVTLDGLSSGNFYIAQLTVMRFDTEADATFTDGDDVIVETDWEPDSETIKMVVATEGHTPDWNWNGTNYSAFHPDFDTGYSETGESYTGPDGLTYSALSYFNATAAQTQSAYQAITGGGKTSDFPAQVWNDLIDRIARVQREWGYTARLDNTWPVAYVASIDPEYREWPILGDMLVKPGRSITAKKFNMAVNAIPITTTWPWEKELGRKEIKANDICKGSYFLSITNALNHWLTLVPLPVALSDEFIHGMSGVTTQISSVLFNSSGGIKMSDAFSADSIPSVQVAHSHRAGVLTDKFDLYVETGAIPFTSEFNFFYHESTCSSAVVPVYVIGSFSDTVKQPTHSVNLDFASSHEMAVSDYVQAIQQDADLVNPQGCVIGEHGYTFGTEYVAQIDSAVSAYLEHKGAYGIVSKFTITPKDEQDTEMVGKIGIVGTIDNLVTVGANVLNHDGSIPVVGDVEFTSSVGGAADYTGSLSVSGKCDIRSTDIVPLELSGEVGISATVDDMRIGKIYEISDASSNVTVTPDAAIRRNETKNLGDVSMSVEVGVSADNNTNDPIEMSSDVSTSIRFDDAFLKGQKDVSISGSAKSGFKTKSAANVARYQFAESNTEIVLGAKGEAVFKRPSNAEGNVAVNVNTVHGEIVCKPYVTSESNVSVGQTSEAKVHTINMVRTKMAVSKASVLLHGSAELLTVKGQKDAESEHIISVSANSTLEYTVSAYVGGAIFTKIDADSILNKLEGREFESVAKSLISYEAQISAAYASLILASELEDSLASELDDATVYDVERILTFNKEYEQLFSVNEIKSTVFGQASISEKKADTIIASHNSEVQMKVTLDKTRNVKSENTAESEILMDPLGVLQATEDIAHASSGSEKVTVTYEAGITITPASEINKYS